MDAKKRKSSWIFTAFNIALCVVLVPVILMNVAIIINTYTHPDEIPGLFGIKPVAVLSGSMEDTFMTGDLILIKKTDTGLLKEGDVICYLLDSQAVTHRIVGVEQDSNGQTVYRTKGDANNTEDQNPVKPEQVQGVWTSARLKGMGNFVVFLSSTTGMIVFIVCPIVLLIVWDAIRRLRADKKEKERTAQLEAELNALKERNENSETNTPVK